jgi:hypothetical protein
MSEEPALSGAGDHLASRDNCPLRLRWSSSLSQNIKVFTMSISIRLHNIRCNDERNEASSSEEIYILLTSVQFKRTIPGLPSLHNLRVERFGPWEDFDAGESIFV